MQLTTKTEYSVRALVTLKESRDSLRSINEICTMQNLPKKYVEQLFRKLKKDLVINSVPGSKGGYYLMMPAHEITLGFIMEIVENHPYEVSCERSKIELEYCQIENCQYRHLWHEVYSNIKNYLNTITLQDIKNRIDKE